MDKLNGNIGRASKVRYFKRTVKIFFLSKLLNMRKKSQELGDKAKEVFNRLKTLPNLFRARVFRVAGLIVLIVLLLIAGYFLGARFSTNKSSSGVVDSASTIKQPLNLTKTTIIDKTFTIPGSDKDGKTKGELKITLTKAEKNNKIAIGDKVLDTSKETRFSGQVFLLVFIEAENSTIDQLSFPLVNVFRLIDSKGRSNAPDLANESVSVLPLSIKKDQIAFLVDAKQNNFKLQVGELSGEKHIIEIAFPN